jgi:SAM-dependent MidA family methyltransferase
MRAALYDEDHGYYRRHDRQRWGREGDYRTSPERSSLFAATFARYFAQLHEELQSPAAWTIVEVGAGDGWFAHGLLASLRDRFPQVFSATQYVIDELNTNFSSVIRSRLEPFAGRVQFRSLQDTRPVNPGLIFSNELLDAFPVHRLTVFEGKLCEFYVGVGASEVFEWKPGPLSSARLDEQLKTSGIELKEGQAAEVSLEIEEWLSRAVSRLAEGYLITVDYGDEAAELYSASERYKGTLRAFYQHQLIEDVLARPGEQDITSTVNWTLVKRVAEALGLETVKFERQDKFLLEAGFLEELEMQSRHAATEAERLRLSVTARDMILPPGMAASFQVLVQRKRPS